MVSSSLSFLRTAPQSQADIYNTYMKKATPIRQDIYVTGDAKLAQLQKLITTATNGLQDLQDSANTAEKAIRNAALPTRTSPSEVSMHKVKFAFELHLELQDICSQLVADNDRDAFSALREFIPFTIIASTDGSETARRIKNAKDVILQYEKQLMTTDEVALLDEVRELDGCINWLRQNFTDLQTFFNGQLLPTAVAGTFVRLKQLSGWFGLRGVYSGQTSILLSDDFGGSLAPSTFYVPTR